MYFGFVLQGFILGLLQSYKAKNNTSKQSKEWTKKIPSYKKTFLPIYILNVKAKQGMNKKNSFLQKTNSFLYTYKTSKQSKEWTKKIAAPKCVYVLVLPLFLYFLSKEKIKNKNKFQNKARNEQKKLLL